MEWELNREIQEDSVQEKTKEGRATDEFSRDGNKSREFSSDFFYFLPKGELKVVC